MRKATSSIAMTLKTLKLCLYLNSYLGSYIVKMNCILSTLHLHEHFEIFALRCAQLSCHYLLSILSGRYHNLTSRLPKSFALG